MAVQAEVPRAVDGAHASGADAAVQPVPATDDLIDSQLVNQFGAVFRAGEGARIETRAALGTFPEQGSRAFVALRRARAQSIVFPVLQPKPFQDDRHLIGGAMK